MIDIKISHRKTNNIFILDDQIAGIEIIKKNGQRILYKIDREDISKIECYRWYVHNGYCATRYINRKEINLSQLIVGRPPKGFVVHHINGDKTDYRKKNLQIVTWSVNNYFKRVQRNNTSSIRGVHIYKDGSIIANHGSKKYYCKSIQEAIKKRKAYNDQMMKCISVDGIPPTIEWP